jgi:hypothetical protein
MSNIPITSLPLVINLTANVVLPCVQGGTTKQVPLSTIAAQISPSAGVSATIIDGATIGDPYVVAPGVTRVLFDKTVGAASYVLFGLSIEYGTAAILVKDIKGDAASNPITIQFSGGELADGLSTIVLDTAYAGVRVTPYPMGGGYYITAG